MTTYKVTATIQKVPNYRLQAAALRQQSAGLGWFRSSGRKNPAVITFTCNYNDIATWFIARLRHRFPYAQVELRMIK